jgi:hypothetical protein
VLRVSVGSYSEEVFEARWGIRRMKEDSQTPEVGGGAYQRACRVQ